ncbi:MAG: hypothetical protein WC312_06450 [Candidatus Omnitrophota bacterium]|jgi:hypothetical protein
MSIVNDALKKAGKEFEFNAGKGKRAVFNPAFLITTAVLSCLIIVLYMIRPANKSVESNRPGTAAQQALNNIEHKSILMPMKPRNMAKLDGIVYGDKERWAIVNDNIVKEGDKLLGGEITAITENIVKIRKNDGSEITLSLK